MVVIFCVLFLFGVMKRMLDSWTDIIVDNVKYPRSALNLLPVQLQQLVYLVLWLLAVAQVKATLKVAQLAHLAVLANRAQFLLVPVLLSASPLAKQRRQVYQHQNILVIQHHRSERTVHQSAIHPSFLRSQAFRLLSPLRLPYRSLK